MGSGEGARSLVEGRRLRLYCDRGVSGVRWRREGGWG